MAGIDYFHCNICRGKAFYDATLNWRKAKPGEQTVRGFDRLTLDYCGDIAALCTDCAKTHKCTIVPIGDDDELV